MPDVSITFNIVVILKLYLFKEKEKYSARIFESAKVNITIMSISDYEFIARFRK